MDEGIGQIMQTLRELNLDQNTIVFFCSDNGARFGSNGELRGDKGSVWEGGHRVPAIAWYPDFIEAGSTTDEVVISMDLVPTLLTMAGIETSASFDGIDFSSVMLRQSPLKERPLFWRYHGQLAVRKGNWKYLSINNEEYLFNLQADLAEENNQIDQNTEITKEMKTLLTNWENEMEAYKQKTK